MTKQTEASAAATAAEIENFNSTLASSTSFFLAPLAQGKPHGQTLDRTGLGPNLFAHLALDHVEHGGDAKTMENSFALILCKILICKSSLKRSSPALRQMSTFTTLPVGAITFNIEARSPSRGGPANKK